jgi:acyl carrier protein
MEDFLFCFPGSIKPTESLEDYLYLSDEELCEYADDLEVTFGITITDDDISSWKIMSDIEKTVADLVKKKTS